MGPRRRRVTWTETALRGLDSSIAFVARQSIENAHRLLERVLGAAESLGILGERGSSVPEYG
jgi:plasmid stabilization system protein ParE